MDYRLIVVTHGDSAPLERTLTSFRQMVTPLPKKATLVYDGPYAQAPLYTAMGVLYGASWEMLSTGGVGFCGATEQAWRQATVPARPDQYVFWLEHDFDFTQPVDLERLALVLRQQPGLAQMALMRDAANKTEKQAGGLYESRRDDYTLCTLGGAHVDRDPLDYLEHRAYFTTNPSLMRWTFMYDNPWPAYNEQCEGRFGIELVERGYTFGAWGRGEPWVEHTGKRTGFGY